MCFFPVKVSLSFCGNRPGSCEEKNNKRKVEKREHIFKQKQLNATHKVTDIGNWETGKLKTFCQVYFC